MNLKHLNEQRNLFVCLQPSGSSYNKYSKNKFHRYCRAQFSNKKAKSFFSLHSFILEYSFVILILFINTIKS